MELGCRRTEVFFGRRKHEYRETIGSCVDNCRHCPHCVGRLQVSKQDAGSIDVDTVQEAANRPAKALESGDASKINAQLAKHYKVLQAKPSKLITDASVRKVSTNSAIIAYTLVGKRLSQKVDFKLTVDQAGNAHYFANFNPFVTISSPSVKLNGTEVPYIAPSELGTAFPEQYVLPGEYRVKYQDDIFAIDTTAKFGVGSLKR